MDGSVARAPAEAAAGVMTFSRNSELMYAPKLSYESNTTATSYALQHAAGARKVRG